jgi:hypothetical protein
MPRLPVAYVRIIFSRTSTIAEPTEASAATCLVAVASDIVG